MLYLSCISCYFLEAVTFLQLFEGHRGLHEIVRKLDAPPGEKLHLQGIYGSALTVLAALLHRKIRKSILVLLPEKEDAAYFYDDMASMGLEPDTCFFPSSCKRSVQFGQPDRDNLVLRTGTLNRILAGDQLVVVTYPEGLVEKVPGRDALLSDTLTISRGEKISIDFINDFLYEFGFERVDFVTEPGQFSVRGSIVDIFSYAHEDPFRLDFFGNEVESIRSFEIDTQFSAASFDRITLMPDIRREDARGKWISLVEFMGTGTVCLSVNGRLTSGYLDAITGHTLRENSPGGPIPGEILLGGLELEQSLRAVHCLEAGGKPIFPSEEDVHFHISKQPLFSKNFNLLGENMEGFLDKGYRLLFMSAQEKQIGRLKEIFGEIRKKVAFEPVPFELYEGFIDHDLRICCYTDHQIFERYHRFRLRTVKPQREVITLRELNKLHPGDYVVHVDHGIGRFAGLVKTEVNGKIQEAIRLVYRDNDTLLVSIHSLHRISKYRGKDGTEPALNKLGSGAWQTLKNRTKSKVKDIARELIALYARRRSESGFSFSPDSYLQTELEASFMYEDTPDQEKATQAVKEDMEKPTPMDRLVCGDVGFGKTEVAIRAAFKAVGDSKQVAVLVPTTILALQHYQTFSERLAGFPANVGYVSRLRSASDVRNTLKSLEEGRIDILIGTHRLISRDVKFRDLGLLIIDEEQKFGVTVKEKLKQLKVNLDTLTLTATPIPRTLQFSLMGARDLSIIQTPPPNRYPIVTEIHGFNEQLISEAIVYEVGRNGQVFFIHNRVQTIYEVEETIRRIVPGVKTVVGHGQMEGAALEKVMLDYISGRYDVLIATTIIESGLDIPNANTMIINEAQNFGLGDLHQLRGRVGRSNKKAFCYLLTPPLSTLTPEARRRLKAVEEFSDLGSGFNLSMQDLDIRGAGNLLGAEQSGFIADIGFETYHRILNEAIHELKNEEFPGLLPHDEAPETGSKTQSPLVSDCQIDTDLELLFPETYIPGTAERMLLYRELDSLENPGQMLRFEAGLKDRFGPIPPESVELLDVVRLRWLASRQGIEKIVLKNECMICHFPSDQRGGYFGSDEFGRILTYVKANQRKCRMKENGKLTLTFFSVHNVGEAIALLSGIEDQPVI